MDQYTCKMCGQSFSSQDELNRHNQTQHADQMTRTGAQGGTSGPMGGTQSGRTSGTGTNR